MIWKEDLFVFLEFETFVELFGKKFCYPQVKGSIITVYERFLGQCCLYVCTEGMLQKK